MIYPRLPIEHFVRLGSISLQTGPFGSQLHSYDYVDAGVPVVPTEAIRNRRIDRSSLPHVSHETAQRLSKHQVILKDILFARRGAQATGQTAIVRHEDVGAVCGTGAIRLRVNSLQNDIDATFLSHYLSTSEAVSWIRVQAIGATMPNLNEGIIKRLAIPLPSFSEQLLIATTLDSIDDKIELNRRMNETLEAMAQAIFRDWFVDFGPTRRKLEGATDPLTITGGLVQDTERAQALADLFPDALGDDGLPEGWRLGVTSALVEFNPKEPLKKGTPAPYSDMSSLPTSGPLADPPVEREYGSGMRFRNGDALLARITPCLENGKSAFVDFLPDAQTVGWGSTEFYVLRSRTGVPAPFSYLLVRHPEFRAAAVASMTGTSGRQRAQVDRLEDFPFAEVPMELLVEFGKFILPMFDKITANGVENRALAATRDLLLPKLMSGEIRLSEAEGLMEAAQ